MATRRRLAWEVLLSCLLSIRDTQRVLSEELSEQKRKEDPGEIYFGWRKIIQSWMPGIIWSPLNGGNQQSIIKGPREYEGYYVLVAWWREKERRCWDFIESMSISKGDKQTHGNAEKIETKIGEINELHVCVWTQYIRQPWLLDLSDIDFGLVITRLMWILVYGKYMA